MTTTPSGAFGHLHAPARGRPGRRRAPTATAGRSMPADSATAAAASALETWCAPTSCNCTGADAPAACSVKPGRPEVVEHDVVGAHVGVRGCAEGRRRGRGCACAIADTSASSALSTATPSGGRPSTSSPLACAIASRLPNSPRCARPDVEHRRRSAAARPRSGAGCARSRARRVRAPGSGSSRRRAAPCTDGRARCWPSRPRRRSAPAVASTLASRSLVEVLPDEPVTPITVAVSRRATTDGAAR